MRNNLNTFKKLKYKSEKFSCLTAYDASFALSMEQAGVECLLVGDSLGMVVKGQETTLSVSIEEMVYHTKNVARATSTAFIMSDLPFGCSVDAKETYHHAAKLMAAGANMVKIEGGSFFQQHVNLLSQSGIPVCSHLGLLPQSVHKVGGYKIQGKDEISYTQILDDAKLMQASGADMLLLECVPPELSKEITSKLSIPVIGIGAGQGCDAQVLVCYDMLGLTPGGGPSFSHDFLADTGNINQAFRAYVEAVKSSTFPHK